MENNLVLWLNDFGEEYVHGMPETLSIVGGAVAETGGQPLVMKKDGGLFEIYTSLTAGTYSFDDTNLSGGGTVTEDGVYRIRVDYHTDPVTVDRQKINRLYAWYPWGQLDLFDLSYAGNSTFKVEDKTWTPTSDNRFRIRMQVGDDNTIETYGPKDGGTFVLIGNGQWGAGNDYNYGVDKSKYFKTGLPFSMTVDLSPATGYSVTVTDYISDQDINDYSLTVMGSSVPNGEGATGKVGYAQMYQQYLASEAQHSWTVIHKSVNGNNTTQLMARWGRDFLPTKSRYIYYGLSLANEGIRTSGQTAFNSYQNNMATLIAWARDIGRVPLAGNVYPQSLYNATDYNYVKRMNLLMHEWDIPTVNLLGAVDDGNGRWVSDCRYDDGHPNTKGHTEMFYAFVPSLLDALSEGKAQPQLDGSTSITLTKDNAQQIVWNPENILHSFTLSFSFKTGATSGTIASFTTENNSSAYLEIDADGKLVYHTVSASGQLKSSASVNDGTWHQVSLTHYYARGATFLYMDGIPVTGSIAERLAPTRFCLNDIENTLESVDFRDLFFHRSGMTPEEIAALHSGRMLKSSLEIYAPLDDSAGTPDLYNSAQSLNTLSMEDQNSSSDIEDIIYMMDTDFKEIAIYSITGQLVLLSSDTYLNSLDTLKTGVYVVKMATWKGEMTTRKIAVK
jgi:lysophospholipase L1-like esterase